MAIMATDNVIRHWASDQLQFRSTTGDDTYTHPSDSTTRATSNITLERWPPRAKSTYRLHCSSVKPSSSGNAR